MRRTTFALVVLVLPALCVLGGPLAGAADAAPCTVRGTPGPDVLVGTPGRDVICGRGGADVLRGGDGNDLLIGGRGHDQLYPGPGRNTVGGGRGQDTVRYDPLSDGVEVDLVRGRTRGAVHDTLARIENVVGTADDDRIIGTPGANVLDGGAGRDVIQPRGGDDIVHGGGDSFGRYHSDTLSYHGVSSGVTIDMTTGTVDGAGHTTFDGIIDIAGTNRDDVLVAGDDSGTAVFGFDGDDLITGTVECGLFSGGGGDDTLVPGLPSQCANAPGEVDGLDGADTVTYADADGGITAEGASFAWWRVTGPDAARSWVTGTETFVGTPASDDLSDGQAGVGVTFEGGGGIDTIDTTDGFDNDTISAAAGSTCSGDAGDTISC